MVVMLTSCDGGVVCFLSILVISIRLEKLHTVLVFAFVKCAIHNVNVKCVLLLEELW